MACPAQCANATTGSLPTIHPSNNPRTKKQSTHTTCACLLGQHKWTVDKKHSEFNSKLTCRIACRIQALTQSKKGTEVLHRKICHLILGGCHCKPDQSDCEQTLPCQLLDFYPRAAWIHNPPLCSLGCYHPHGATFWIPRSFWRVNVFLQIFDYIAR